VQKDYLVVLVFHVKSEKVKSMDDRVFWPVVVNRHSSELYLGNLPIATLGQPGIVLTLESFAVILLAEAEILSAIRSAAALIGSFAR